MSGLSGYASIPAHLLGELSTHELAVYVVLSAHMNTADQVAWPSHSTIAALSGLSVPSVQRALTGLRDKGLITWVWRRRAHGGRTSNLYAFTPPSTAPSTGSPQIRPQPGPEQELSTAARSHRPRGSVTQTEEPTQ